MLQIIRDRATGWIAYTIIGLLIIPFALWGINSYFTDPAPVEAAEVGDAKISLREFQRAYQQRRRQLQNMFGERFDPALLGEAGLKIEVLQQLVNEHVLVQAARQQGFRVGDQKLLQELQSIEAFQQDGEFDPDLYQRVINSQGYSREGFEENLRVSLATEQFREGLVNSSLLTRTELERLIGLLKQQRKISYIVLPAERYRNEVAVDETAIKDYFEKNTERFRSPEKVKVQYLELELEQMAEDIPVSDEELKAAYEEQIAKFTQPEKRSASHILVSVSEDNTDEARVQAEAIHQAIASGSKTFQQAMEEAEAGDTPGLEGGELGVISKGFYDDPAFESALYGLQEVGDISEPIRTPFGFHIIRLDDQTPGQVKSFEEVRDEVARELRVQRAEARFYEAVETLTNLSYEHPNSLEPAAVALGLKVRESEWFERGAGQGVAAYPKVAALAYSDDVLKQGYNSEPIEVQPNHVVVLRLQAHKKAAPLTLDEARDKIIQQLKIERARDALQRDVETLRKRAQQGEDWQALAEEFGGKLHEAGLVGRTDDELDSEILREAFGLTPPQEGEISTGEAVLRNGDRAVVMVSQVVSGDQEELPEEERIALTESLTQELGTAEFEAILKSLRRETEVVMYTDRL